MAALGAEEVVNLDGGGSTAMRVDERLVNRPSDATGERPIGDAVVLLPQKLLSHQQAGALRRPFSPVVAANMVAQKAIS